MKLFTIGFTKKNAKQFFESLRTSGAKRVIDIRLNNVSQLAGFTKKNDLAYFLEKICGIDYVHLPMFAPTQELLDGYKKNHGDWKVYERKFLDLMNERHVIEKVELQTVQGACLLCSEAKPDHCHRRLVAEILQQHWPQLNIDHL